MTLIFLQRGTLTCHSKLLIASPRFIEWTRPPLTPSLFLPPTYEAQTTKPTRGHCYSLIKSFDKASVSCYKTNSLLTLFHGIFQEFSPTITHVGESVRAPTIRYDTSI